MASPSRTRARIALRELIEAKKFTISGLAREIGVSQPTASDWVNGKSRPDAHLRAAIERLLGIKAEHWMTDAEYRVAFGQARAA